jgi:hypothetical protein
MPNQALLVDDYAEAMEAYAVGGLVRSTIA